MPRSTNIPERVVALLENAAAPLPLPDIAEALKANQRTLGTHLRALVESGYLTRAFVYFDQGGVKVGHYVYSPRSHKSRAPAG